jgi:hypothetical protein
MASRYFFEVSDDILSFSVTCVVVRGLRAVFMMKQRCSSRKKMKSDTINGSGTLWMEKPDIYWLAK